MTDIALYRRLMRKRKTPIKVISDLWIAGMRWTPEEQKRGLKITWEEPPSRWQRFCEAWTRLGSR